MLLIPGDTFRRISEPFSLIAIAPPLMLMIGYLAAFSPKKEEMGSSINSILFTHHSPSFKAEYSE